jgi:hypothetical protein
VKTKLFVSILAMAASFASPGFAFAPEGYTWTPNRTVLMHLSLPTGLPPGASTFPDGATSFNAVAEEALNIWNQYLVHMKFAVDRNSILPPSDTDGNTSVLMTKKIYGDDFGTGTLAVTLVTPRGSTFVEADVVFNSNVAYSSYRGDYDPQIGAYDFRRVALHEFGHVVGLDHPDQANPKQTKIAIMNSHISNVFELQADDIAGAHSLYDNGPPLLNGVPASSLVNLSTRAFVGTGENAVIGGFIVQGSQPATVVLRGIGNSLPALGITDALSDPVIELHSSDGSTLQSSDDWIDDANASTIASYHLDPTNSRESAIIATLNPGSYTVVLRSYDNGDGILTGTGLIELYDLHTTGGRAGNIATRGQVTSGDRVLIGGFIVGGNQTKEVVVRAIGPSLAPQISTPLSDPTVELRDAAGNLVDSNNNWGDHPKAGLIQAEGLAPKQAAESALQVTLNPGSYTAIVRSANGGTGVGLVEIYDLSPAP